MRYADRGLFGLFLIASLSKPEQKRLRFAFSTEWSRVVPSLNIDFEFPTHPKTRRLVGLLGKGSEVACLRLWIYCGKYHAEDGELAGYSAQEIESCCEWWGKPGAMVEAMLNVKGPSGFGFLEKTEDGYRVHDWLEYQGHINAQHAASLKANKVRWDKYRAKHGLAPPSPKRTPYRTPNGSPLNGTELNTPKPPQAGADGGETVSDRKPRPSRAERKNQRLQDDFDLAKARLSNDGN